jgi:hypothetical protein
MRRIVSWAVSGCAQAPVQPDSPQEPDPHENSVEQNAPTGDPDAAKPTNPPKPQVVEPLTAVESEDAILGTRELVPERSHFSPNATPPKEVRPYVKTSQGTVRSMAGPAGNIAGKAF